METQDDHSRRRKFENLMRLIESSYPFFHLHKKEIERQFSKLTHTPDHPPYASIIQRAITELNELGGSSEETISKFIEAQYKDLPFAHASQLTQHLQKLVKKGDIISTSGNCYILTNESSDFCYKLKKEQKRLRRRSQKGRQNGRQHKVKGVKLQKQKKIKESREKTQVNGTICKGFEEQKPAEGNIGPTGEQENEGYVELIEKNNEVEEIQFKANDELVESEKYNEGNEQHNQKQEQQKQQQKEKHLQQIQVLGKTGEILVKENNKTDNKNQAENHNGVAEEEQRELDKEVMEEQQIQMPAEGYIGPTGEQENEGNMLVQFIKKEKKEHASMSRQSYAISQNVNLLGLLHLSKEELFELLKKTNKVRGNLSDSLKLEVSENNESNPKMGGQQELIEERVLHFNPCKGQPKEEQRLEACGKLKVSEHWPKTTSISENVPMDLMQLEQNNQIKLPTHKRMPEAEITTLEELFYKQNKQIKLSKLQKAPKSQPKLNTVPLDVPCDSSRSKNENKHVANERAKSVPEDNSTTTESHRKYSREAKVFEREAGHSYLVGLIEQFHESGHGSPGKLPESRSVTSSLNVLQELSLEHQHLTTFSNEAKGLEYKQPTENSIEGSLTEHEITAVDHQFQPQRQMPSNSQLAANTSVARQMQKQHQQSGPRPSECEPLLMTIEADHDLIIASLKSELKQKSIPSTKRMQEPRPKTVVELSQPTEHRGQKKQLKSGPTEATVDSTVTSVQQTKDLLQQRQLDPQGQGPSQSGIKQKARKPFPLKLQQHEKEQPKSRGRGRPPKPKTNVDANLIGSLVIGHQNHNAEQPKHRGRGRPPKSRLFTSMDASLPPQHQCKHINKKIKIKSSSSSLRVEDEEMLNDREAFPY